ncbi:MAG TPA: hypothetical protein ENN38_01020 [Actinobacteria bacterium]|nr:hypothetical protein [Actinomycetota bacterium]
MKSTNIEIDKEISSKFLSWTADHFLNGSKITVVQAPAELAPINRGSNSFGLFPEQPIFPRLPTPMTRCGLAGRWRG